jgi:hypothetical protein
MKIRMRILQENDGFKVVACDYCGSMFHWLDGAIPKCEICGADGRFLIDREEPIKKPEPPKHYQTAPNFSAVTSTTAGLPPRCAICGSGFLTVRLKEHPMLHRLCDSCIEMIHAINTSIEEMVRSEKSALIGTVMRKVRGKCNPQIASALLDAFQLQEKLT